MEPVDRLVGEVVLEVVLLAGLGLRDADDLLVLGDQRVVLPGLTAEEAPEVVEPQPRRPAVERPREPLLVVRRQMPLPEPSRHVAVLLEDARERRAIVRDRRVVAREGAGELAHHAEADAVVVAPRQQRRPGRRAQRRDVEAVVAQPVVREPGVVRRRDRTAEGARVAEAGVVDQHEQHVRRTLGRLDVARLVPVRPSSRRASGSSRHRTADAGSEAPCGRSRARSSPFAPCVVLQGSQAAAREGRVVHSCGASRRGGRCASPNRHEIPRGDPRMTRAVLVVAARRYG